MLPRQASQGNKLALKNRIGIVLFICLFVVVYICSLSPNLVSINVIEAISQSLARQPCGPSLIEGMVTFSC